MTLGERHDDEEQEDRANCPAHLRLCAHRQQERPEPHTGQLRRHEASQDRRIRLSPVRPQGDRVADEDEGEQRIMCALGHMRGWKRTSRFHPQMVRAGS